MTAWPLSTRAVDDGEMLGAIPERRALRTDVRDALTRAIVQRRFAPGERIVESRVARELGVSQTAVREALRELESVGLVTHLVNRGCVIRKLTPADVVEIYRLRALLEGEAARRAAERLSPDDVASLDALVDDMESLGEAHQIAELAALDVSFHRAIVEAADHKLLTRLWLMTNPELWMHLAEVGVADLPLPVVVRRHRAVVDALRARNAEAAHAAIVYHFEDCVRDLELGDGGEATDPAPASLRS